MIPYLPAFLYQIYTKGGGMALFSMYYYYIGLFFRCIVSIIIIASLVCIPNVFLF